MAGVPLFFAMLGGAAIYKMQYHPKVGLYVHLRKPVVPYPGAPLTLRVESTGDLYLNGQPVSWYHLGPTLGKELSRRPPRFPVYIETGAGDMEWQQVVKAIDIVQGMDGQVVLLTAPEKPN